MIPVTKPYLPPVEVYQKYIQGIWQRQWLTNNGPLVNKLELKLKNHLNIDHFLYLGNGTVALQIAIKALGLKGEIITTPFSYVATTSSIVWEGCKPVFVDIDEETLNLDPEKIEQAITAETTAIIATHCFGNSCDIDSIQNIAKKYNLKVIYDAAHCFGTTYKGRSILDYGDVSTISFHATKLMHTTEGGGVITKDPKIVKRMAYMRNFGHDSPFKFNGVGINGKNSEFHAAMGLCVLENISEILEKRKEQSKYYDVILKNLQVRKPTITENCGYNYAYYPIIFENKEMVVKTQKALEKNNIFPRRYFYPSLSTLDYVENPGTPVSDKISSSILCLPLYYDLSVEEQDFIARIMIRTQNYE